MKFPPDADSNAEPRRIARSHGWTLVELLVVMTVIVILSAIALPVYQESVRKARRAEARAAVMEIMQRQERHFSLHGTYAAFDRMQPKGYRWHLGDDPRKSAYELSGSACAGGTIAECIVVIARPGTAAVNSVYRDEYCGELVLASNGMKSSAGADCW